VFNVQYKNKTVIVCKHSKHVDLVTAAVAILQYIHV